MAPRSNNNSRGGKKKEKLTKTIVVGPFRMAFPALFEPEETDNGDRYKVTMLFPPDSPSIKVIDDALYEAMTDYFGDEADWPTGRNDAGPDDKFYDAGTKDYQGFKKGWMALTASSTDAPGIIDADKQDVISKREVYGGRWARAQISVTTYDNKSKGVTAYLNHVQLLENDEAFSGRGSAEDAFDKYELKDRGNGRKSRDDDDEDRGSRGRGRDRDRDDDRDDKRGSSDRGSSRRSRDDDEDDKGRGRGGDRDRKAKDDDEDDNRGRSGDRGRGRDRGRDEDEEDAGKEARGRGRGRDRDEDDDKASSRSSSRRDKEDEDDRDERPSSRSSGRGRGDDDDKPSRGGRGRSREDDRDNGWN